VQESFARNNTELLGPSGRRCYCWQRTAELPFLGYMSYAARGPEEQVAGTTPTSSACPDGGWGDVLLTSPARNSFLVGTMRRDWAEPAICRIDYGMLTTICDLP